MHTVLVTIEGRVGPMDLEVPGELPLRDLIPLLPPELLPDPSTEGSALLVLRSKEGGTLSLDRGLIAANVMDGAILELAGSEQPRGSTQPSDLHLVPEQWRRPSASDNVRQLIPEVVEGWERLS